MHFQTIIHHYGYFGVFMIIFIEAIGFPFPAETTLTLSGIEWTHGVFKLVPLWFAASVGNIVGSTIAYGIGAFLGRPIVLYLGKYIGITEARLNKANIQFQRYELAVIIVAKFIAGIRILVPYLAGINRMKFWIFWPINALSAVLWSGAFIIGGHFIGIAFGKAWPFLHRHLVVFILLAAVILLLFVLMRIGLHRRKKRRMAIEQANQTTEGDSSSD